MGRKPQAWLKDGDVVEVGIDQIGTWYVDPKTGLIARSPVALTTLPVPIKWNSRSPRPRFEGGARNGGTVKSETFICGMETDPMTSGSVRVMFEVRW